MTVRATALAGPDLARTAGQTSGLRPRRKNAAGAGERNLARTKTRVHSREARCAWLRCTGGAGGELTMMGDLRRWKDGDKMLKLKTGRLSLLIEMAAERGQGWVRVGAVRSIGWPRAAASSDVGFALESQDIINRSEIYGDSVLRSGIAPNRQACMIQTCTRPANTATDPRESATRGALVSWNRQLLVRVLGGHGNSRQDDKPAQHGCATTTRQCGSSPETDMVPHQTHPCASQSRPAKHSCPASTGYVRPATAALMALPPCRPAFSVVPGLVTTLRQPQSLTAAPPHCPPRASAPTTIPTARVAQMP
jgi:hypothetical protein